MASCDTVNNVIKWVCVGLGITAGGIVLGTGIKEGIKFWAENNPAAIAAKQAGGLAAGGLSLAAGSLNAAEAKGLSIPGGGIEMSNLSGNIPNSTDLTKMANNPVTNATNAVNSQVGNAQAALQGQMSNAQDALKEQANKANTNLNSQVGNAQAALQGQMSNAQSAVQGQMSDAQAALQGQMSNAQSAVQGHMSDAQAALQGQMSAVQEQMDSVNSQATDQSDKLNSTLAAARKEKEARIAQGLQATSNLANTANSFTRSVKDGVVVNTPKTPPQRGTVIFSGEHSEGDDPNTVTSSTNYDNRSRVGGGRKTKSKRSKLTNEPKVKKPRTKKCLIEKDNKMYMSFCI